MINFCYNKFQGNTRNKGFRENTKEFEQTLVVGSSLPIDLAAKPVVILSPIFVFVFFFFDACDRI